MLWVEMVAVPASDTKNTQNTHQAPVLLEPLTQRRVVIPALVFPVAYYSGTPSGLLRQPALMCLRSSFTTSSAFVRRRIYPDFASITPQNRSIPESKRVNNRVRSGANRRQFRKKHVQFISIYSTTYSDAIFALEEHFLAAVGSEIGRSVTVTTHDPVQALFSTTAKVSSYH